MLASQPIIGRAYSSISDILYRIYYIQNQTVQRGMRFPDVNYLPEEHSCWNTIYTRLECMWPFTACNEFLVGYQILMSSGLLKKDRIPNISKISKFLESKTGFRLRPASGLCPAREFLACLGLVFKINIQ